MRVFFVLQIIVLLFISVESATLCKGLYGPRRIIVNPPALFDPLPFGYSHIAIDTHTRLAFIAGQVPLNKRGVIVGKTLQEQIRFVEKNLKIALNTVGANVDDIVKLNGYIVNFNPKKDLPIFNAAGRRLGSPPSTVISTPSLAVEGLLIEIEITAIVSNKHVRKLICDYH